MSGDFEIIDDGWSEDKYVALTAAKKACHELEVKPKNAEPRSVVGKLPEILERKMLYGKDYPPGGYSPET